MKNTRPDRSRWAATGRPARCARPASGSPQDPGGAIGIHQRGGISSWDAMIIRSAAEIGCPVLYSEDLNVGQDYPGIHVENPLQLPEANQA